MPKRRHLSILHSVENRINEAILSFLLPGLCKDIALKSTVGQYTQASHLHMEQTSPSLETFFSSLPLEGHAARQDSRIDPGGLKFPLSPSVYR